jgi:Holliday junction resolvasome RuvABC endonuclease subunit
MNKSSRIPFRILAIDPGIREMGIAVLDDEKLIHHGVLCLRDRRAPKDIRTYDRDLLRTIIVDYHPDLVALERTMIGNSGNSATLNRVSAYIRRLCRRQGVPIRVLAASTVKKHLTGSGQASKTAVARAVARRYPELRVYLRQKVKWKTRFQANRFDAVGLGIVASERKNA